MPSDTVRRLAGVLTERGLLKPGLLMKGADEADPDERWRVTEAHRGYFRAASDLGEVCKWRRCDDGWRVYRARGAADDIPEWHAEAITLYPRPRDLVLDDPATTGVLAAIAREVWGEPRLHAEAVEDGWMVTTLGFGHAFYGNTEAEAWAAAILAGVEVSDG